MDSMEKGNTLPEAMFFVQENAYVSAFHDLLTVSSAPQIGKEKLPLQLGPDIAAMPSKVKTMESKVISFGTVQLY